MDPAFTQLQQLISEQRLPGGAPPTTIIYTRKRETADEIAMRLSQLGIPAVAYHAGLKDAERSAALQRWLSGRVPVVAATVAFGMGIDKADVRWVIPAFLFLCIFMRHADVSLPPCCTFNQSNPPLQANGTTLDRWFTVISINPTSIAG